MQILSRLEAYPPIRQIPSSKAAKPAADLERLAVWLAPIALGALAIGVQYSGADTALASLFYDSEIGTWPLRDHWLVKGILHDGAQGALKLFGAAYLAYVALRLLFGKRDRTSAILAATFLALLSGPLLVGWLKTVTHLACPWDEQIFGGAAPQLRIFDAVPGGTPVGHGFPSAHASSGYAFVALYFAAALFAPRYRFAALTAALLLGVVFGLAQQVRGAHFLSHDLFALGICWLSAGAVFASFFPREFINSFNPVSKTLSQK